MNAWIKENLSKCLDCTITDDVLGKIMSIKTEEQFDEFFGPLLDPKNSQHSLFLLNAKLMLLRGKQGQTTGTAAASTSSKAKGNAGKKRKGGKAGKPAAHAGKPLGEPIILKGRRKCNCEAREHQLVNNCTHCGRVVCEQEGPGACLFCGARVLTKREEMEMLAEQAKAEKRLKPEELARRRAVELRNRLLDYERNKEKRTTVIDDEMDYFQDNSVWLTKTERDKRDQLRQQLLDKKYESRAKRKIRIDFTGRELDNHDDDTQKLEAGIIKQMAATTLSKKQLKKVESMLKPILPSNLGDIEVCYMPPREGAPQVKQPLPFDLLERKYNRVQDKELLETHDMRHCLSMHQPWASLLIAGIKKHEGRVWYSGHRGRLWIASAAKQPRPEDIKSAKKFYCTYYEEKRIEFPKNYPTGTLLGCVLVEDCLPQEEYRELYPNGESDSPYVFICTHAQKLPVPLPIQGGHKIFELDLKIHNMANRTLLNSRRSKD